MNARCLGPPRSGRSTGRRKLSRLGVRRAVFSLKPSPFMCSSGVHQELMVLFASDGAVCGLDRDRTGFLVIFGQLIQVQMPNLEELSRLLTGARAFCNLGHAQEHTKKMRLTAAAQSSSTMAMTAGLFNSAQGGEG